MTYDEFRKKPWDDRVHLFVALSPEQKADLVRTHIQHWLEVHKAELSQPQVTMLEEHIAFVTLELYDRDEPSKDITDLMSRTAALFSRDQIREALTMHWEQPPKANGSASQPR